MLDKHPPIVRNRRVNLAHRFEIIFERVTEIRLSGEIAAVADPDGQSLRADFFAQLAVAPTSNLLRSHLLVGCCVTLHCLAVVGLPLWSIFF